MKRYKKMDPIRVGTKRKVIGKHTLGVWEMEPIVLNGDEILEILDRDIYGRLYIKLNDKKFWIWAKVIDGMSNEI